jgi:predicted small lipoprotein YifL
MPSAHALARSLLVAGLLILALSACGRRGPLEAPLSPAELAAQQQRGETRAAGQRAQVDDDEDAQGVVAVPVPTARRRTRAYTVPSEPFILDPLL